MGLDLLGVKACGVIGGLVTGEESSLLGLPGAVRVCLGTRMGSIAVIESICHQEMSMPVEEKRTMNPKHKEWGK